MHEDKRKYQVKLLHLSHTDIKNDSRILKQMHALHVVGYKVSGIGIISNERAVKTDSPLKINLNHISLYSRNLTFFPKIIRHFFSILEMIVKILPQALRERPNIIHCHDVVILPIGCFIKWLTGARLIYDAHELESCRNGLNRFESLLILWIEKFFWPFIDALILVSPSIKLWYQKNIGPKKTTILLNSPSFVLIGRYEENYLRKKFSIPTQNKIFIYVGQFSLGRGIDLLTHVFTNSKVSSHLVFLGFGELFLKLKHLARQHVNIHLHDDVPHSEVIPIVQSADYGLCLIENVSLSDYYSLPNKLFEYCFAGTPVLASDFPDIRIIIKRYNIGECCKVEKEKILKAILKIERKKNVRNFEDLTPLSWTRQEKKLLALYCQIENLS
jgi:glycosyltransferase involved in cell wall biosynthesis